MAPSPFPLPPAALDAIVRRALDEDVGWGDVTTQALVPADAQAEGRFVLREPGVVAGLPVAAAVFAALNASVRWQPAVADGAELAAGALLATVEGPAAAILTGERVALNYLQRLSGIASLTSRYAQALAGTKARLVDTRKTTPGQRLLEKYAVRRGGGSNHRFCLSDGMLIKDNHIAILAAQGVALADVVRRARAAAPHSLRVEVEVDRLEQIAPALAGGADIILLDNMPPPVLGEAVRLIAGRALTEASGGVTLDTIRACAEAGVDLISVGALTHSARALDIGLDIA